MKRVIAIDGPAGSGKSTLAHLISERLGFLHVDSGALYRIITLFLLQNGIDCKDEVAVSKMAQNVKVDFAVKDTSIAYVFDGREVGNEIRTPLVNANVSYVAAVASVRDVVNKILRKTREVADIVMEGRDIATVVFPDADFKFYLDASPEVRAMRRQKEELEKGIAVQDATTVKESLLARDKIDSSRKTAPLKVADGAVVIDSSNLSLEDEIKLIASYL